MQKEVIGLREAVHEVNEGRRGGGVGPNIQPLVVTQAVITVL